MLLLEITIIYILSFFFLLRSEAMQLANPGMRSSGIVLLVCCCVFTICLAFYVSPDAKTRFFSA